jgi:hypothetical protein
MISSSVFRQAFWNLNLATQKRRAKKREANGLVANSHQQRLPKTTAALSVAPRRHMASSVETAALSAIGAREK